VITRISRLALSISATSAAISPGRKVVSAAIAPRAVPERTSFNVGRGTGSATGKQLAKEIRTIANTADGRIPVSQNRFESFMIMASFALEKMVYQSMCQKQC